MEGKKKYFALIIFLFLGLMIFTFANPAEEEKEFKGGDKDQSETVTNKREDTTEDTNDTEQEQQDQNQQQNIVTNNNQGNAQGNQGNDAGQTEEDPVDTTLRDALAAVEKAEGTYSQEDVDAAKELLNNVTDTTEKGNLEERLEEVEAGIAVLALLENLEVQVEEADKKADMTDATSYRDTNEIANKIDALNNETVKEELEKRLTDVSKLLDDNAAPTTKVEAKVYGDNVEITAEDEAGNPFQVFLTKDEENEEEISSGYKTASDGVYTLRLVDNAFNEQTIKFTVDTTEPALKDLTNGAHYKEVTLNTEDKTKVTIKVTNKDKNEVTSVEEGTNLTEDATYEVLLTDEAGNTATYEFAIDNTKPAISTTDNSFINYNKWTEVTDKFLTNVTIKHVALDGTETVKEFTRADFTVGENNENFKLRYKLETEGKYTITATDKNGNKKAETVTMDKKAPVIEEGEDYTLEAGIDTVPELTAKAIDEIQGTWTIEPSYINRHNADGTIDRNIPAVDVNVVGKYNVVFQATDKAGNVSEKKSKMIYVVDTTAPTIHLAGTVGLNKNEYHVESGSKVTLDDIMAKVTDNYDSETTIKPYKADLLISNVASENKYNITDFTNGLDTGYVGRYNIYYEHTDANGNKSKATMLLVMTDTTKPEIILPGTIGLNKNEYHVEAGSKVSYEDLIATVKDATADKTVAPKKADLLISNVASENKYNITDFTNGLDTSYVGRYNIEYTATDKGGNTTTKTMLLVMNDSVKPTLSANVTDGRTYITGEDVTHLIFNVYKKGDSTPVHTVNSKTSAGGKYFSMKTANYGEGIYTVVVTDEGGNPASIETELRYNELTSLNYKDSVTLTNDLAFDGTYTVEAGQTKVIDLNGKTLKLTKTSGKVFTNNGKLIIKNGTIEQEQLSARGIVTNYGELVIENVKIKDASNVGGSTIGSDTGSKLTVKDTEITLTGEGSVAGIFSNGTTEITNTKVTSSQKLAYAIVVNGDATLENVTAIGYHGGLSVNGGKALVKSGTYEATGDAYGIWVTNNSTTNVVIEDGTIKSANAQGLYTAVDDGRQDAGTVGITINGGNFSGKTGALKASFGNSQYNPWDIQIKGGIFKDTDVTQYIDKTVYRQDTTDWGVKEISKIDNVSYLKEVFAKGGSYTLASDLTLNDEMIKVAKNTNLTINTNGKKITGTSSAKTTSRLFTVEKGATLTLTGNGTIEFGALYPDTDWGTEGFPAYATNTIANSGTLIVDGPTLINTTPRGGASYVIDNYAGAHLTINSGTIKQTGDDVAIRMNTATAGEANANTLVINGGTISGRRAIWIHLAGGKSTTAPYVNLTVNGGTLSTTDTVDKNLAIYSYSYGNSFENVKATFNGGTVNGTTAFGATGEYAKTGAEAIVLNGTTFNGNVGIYNEADEWVSLK